jgi:hypothetical protein
MRMSLHHGVASLERQGLLDQACGGEQWQVGAAWSGHLDPDGKPLVIPAA